MAALTNREKRTLRIGGIILSIYLVFFFGVRGSKGLESSRTEYQKLLAETQRLQREIAPYENRVLLTEKLKESFHMDPQKLSRTTLVADASAAIQRAAGSGGLQLGPIRETAARASAKELASMQLEGSGQATAAMTFLHRIGALGFPIIVDAVQINPDTTKPGMIKMHLTIVILDYEQWMKMEVPRA
ncbi:MAG TPA: hypothetical protein VMZ27_05225 [Candidatus Saccharimonadales bacterium]|nr:hypothetical protein [Candidatus Saccharimonadales bacterium]